MARTPRRLWPLLLSVSECGQSLGIDRNEIYAAIRSGALPQFQHGTKKRLLTSDVVQWVKNTWKRTGVLNGR